MKQHSNNNISFIRTFIHLDGQQNKIYSNDFDIIYSNIFQLLWFRYIFRSFKALRLGHLLNTANIYLRAPVPSVSATEQHVRHGCIQAWYLWELSHPERDMPYPTLWG